MMKLYLLLFHDLGKVQVKTTDSNGKDHFKHHAKVGVNCLRAFVDALNLQMNKESGFHSMSYIMTINLPVILGVFISIVLHIIWMKNTC